MKLRSIVLLATLAIPETGWANLGPPSYGGQLTSEPNGIVGVDIVGETLTIDARPLAEGGRVVVEAVYRLDNRGPEKTLDLVFAFGSAPVAEIEVRLGDRLLPSKPAPDAAIPIEWKAPFHTPTLDGSGRLEYLHYGNRQVTPIGFTAVLPPGPQTLTVRYQAEAGRHHDGKPADYRQFAYVLAPARSWASFGGLDLTVQLPPGWKAASSPKLERDGDTLHGKFSEVPADAFELTMQYSAGTAYEVTSRLASILWIVALFGGFGGCVYLGISMGGRRAWGRFLGTLSLGVGWGAAILAAGIFAAIVPDLTMPASEINNYGYAKLFAIVGTFVMTALAVPFGALAALVVGSVARAMSGGRAEPDA